MNCLETPSQEGPAGATALVVKASTTKNRMLTHPCFFCFFDPRKLSKTAAS